MNIVKKFFLTIAFLGICMFAYGASVETMIDFDSSFLIIQESIVNADPGLNLFAVNLTDEVSVEDRFAQREAEILGLGFQKAGKHLKTFRNLYYGGAFLNLILSYKSIKNESSDNAFILAVPGFLLSLMADYMVGKAGEELEIASKSYPSKNSFLLSATGRDLKRYRSSKYIARVFYFAGPILLLLGADNDDENLIIIGVSATVASIVPLLTAPGHVGRAGKNLQATNMSFLQPQYQVEAGKDLEAYKNRFNTGVGLIALGIAGIIGAASADMPELTTVSLITMGAGAFISAYIAPWSIGTAGEKMEMAGNIMLQEK